MAKPRTDRAPVREPAAAAAIAQTPAREPVRATSRTIGASGGTNKYTIAPEILHKLAMEGWDLQWNLDSVLGKPETQARTAMERQGWVSVTGLMWDGLFDGHYNAKGYAGEINVEGQVLQARPMELTQQARAEELQNARQARYVEAQKIKQGTPDGINLDLMNPNHGGARANTFLRSERIPSMPIQD